MELGFSLSSEGFFQFREREVLPRLRSATAHADGRG
jgi:hypothetical protein